LQVNGIGPGYFETDLSAAGGRSGVLGLAVQADAGWSAGTGGGTGGFGGKQVSITMRTRFSWEGKQQ
jgi:hypothetical protein